MTIQIGMSQLFDRQHMLTGGRRIVDHNTKRPPPGNPHFNCGTLERESENAHISSSSLEKFSHKNMSGQQRVFTESSMASFSSSSRSSSLTSLDYNKAAQLEPSSFDRMVFPETPPRDTSASRQTVDFRDFVKDSIYGEVQVPVVKYRDPPRQQLKISDGSCGSRLDRKQITPAKLQGAPSYHHEPRELLRSSSYHSKDGSSFSISKDAPRFSYDGTEINRTRFDSHEDSNSTLKIKDLPRLSLDSREGSMRSLSADSKYSIFSKPMHKDSVLLDHNILQSQQTVNQARPLSLVAKLMGLETLPDTNMGSCRSYPDEDFVSVSSSCQINPRKPKQLPNSTINSLKDPSSPRSRNFDSMKPTSRFPIELAPWKQIEGTSRSQKKPASMSTRDPANALTTFPSVYSEIEKRLSDLEFTQSGKDLRALKQILEAMQSKGLLEAPIEGQGSNFTSHENNRKPQTDQGYASMKRKTVSEQNYKSPIVIMKPANLVEKSGIPASSVISLDGLFVLPKLRGGESIDNRKGPNSGRISKDQIFKSSQRDDALNSVNMKDERTLKTVQSSSTRSRQSAKEGNASIRPRMPQKKAELERRSRPPAPPDSSKSKRQSNKQQAESNSLGGGRRPKQSDGKMSEVSVESRNLSSHENENSARSNEFTDVTSSERSPGISSIRSQSTKASDFMLSGLVEKKSTLTSSEEESAESGLVPPEYSSPVSVLDDVVNKHDFPSPVKYVGKTLKVDASTGNDRNSNTIQRSSVNSFVSISKESNSTSDINRKKLENIENLVQKLRRLNSSHDEARIDYIASLCENTNPDNRYISEILLASGLLLRELGSTLTDFQFHPSGHPINPDLFSVLEQTKASSSTSSKEDCRTKKTTQSEKFRRKLIFDTVNEILDRKLASAGPDSDPWSRQLKLARKALNAQKLLRELCSEIEGFEANNPKCSSDEDEGWKKIMCNDVMHRSERWMDFDDEISGAVLDLERLVFKDLVDEIVFGEYKPSTRKILAK